MSEANSRNESPGLLISTLMRIGPQITSAHVWMYRALGGRIVNRATGGTPVLLVTTIGRRSGKPRTVALGHLRSGDDVIVAGTNGGLPKVPAWVHNLRAHPQAEVELGQERYPVIAEFLEGEERQYHWDQLVNTFSIYDDAQRWSGRRIPLIRLRRNPGTSE